jgi:hypothetical protein
MRIGHKIIKADSGDLDYVMDTGRLAEAWPASAEAIVRVIMANADEQDGFTRSEWLWIRIANGDLILGLFPQDDMYFDIEHLIEADYEKGLT